MLLFKMYNTHWDAAIKNIKIVSFILANVKLDNVLFYGKDKTVHMIHMIKTVTLNTIFSLGEIIKKCSD